MEWEFGHGYFYCHQNSQNNLLSAKFVGTAAHELPQHAALLAEGLPVESYLDTGDRRSFVNAAGPIALHPVFGSERGDVSLIMEAAGYAPLRATGAEVVRLRASLATRAARATRRQRAA